MSTDDQELGRADLIISKGQANYETLSDVPRNVFFLLKAKCPVIAGHLGIQVGNLVLDSLVQKRLQIITPSR